MADNFSQGSYQTARGLSDLGDEYRALLGAAVSDGAFSIKSERTFQGKAKASAEHSQVKHDNLLWTRVLSLQHFAITGAYANQLDEDLAEAAEEIAAESTNQRIAGSNISKENVSFPKARTYKKDDWQLMYNPKDFELGQNVDDLEAYKLSDQRLCELGTQVTRLREHFKLMAESTKAMGDAAVIQ